MIQLDSRKRTRLLKVNRLGVCVCGNEFEIDKKRKYSCSAKCGRVLKSLQKRVHKQCIWCNKELNAYQYSFCSEECEGYHKALTREKKALAKRKWKAKKR